MLKFAPELQPDDIQVTSSGATGEDLKLSPAARRLFPFTPEVKNKEKLNVWEAWEQACSHAEDRPDCRPLLIFRRNHSKLMVCLELEEFLGWIVATARLGDS